MVERPTSTEINTIQGRTYHSFREAIGPDVYTAFSLQQQELPPYLQSILDERKFPNAKFTYFETHQDGTVKEHLFMTQTTVGQGELIADLCIDAEIPETGFIVNNLYFRPHPESAVINVMEEVAGSSAKTILTPTHKHFYNKTANIVYLGSLDFDLSKSRPYGIETWLHEIGHMKHVTKYPEENSLSLGKNAKLILTYAMYRMSRRTNGVDDVLWVKYEPYIQQIINGEKVASNYARFYLQHMSEQTPALDLGPQAQNAEYILSSGLAIYLKVLGNPETLLQDLDALGRSIETLPTSKERLMIFFKAMQKDKRLENLIQGIQTKIRTNTELTNEEGITATLLQHMFFYH